MHEGASLQKASWGTPRNHRKDTYVGVRMRFIVISLIAVIFMACSAAENTPNREIELFHPQKSVVDTTYKVMEE